MKHRRSVLEGIAAHQLASLRSYAELLERYAEGLGLVGPKDVSLVWERHVVDSLRGLACLVRPDRDLVDLGSGAGLPGIPVAIAAPERTVTLLEPMARRGAFLELAAERLGLQNVSVVVARADQVQIRADVCLARAFGGPVDTWSAGSRLLNQRGRVLYYAGRSWGPAAVAALEKTGATAEVCSEATMPWEGPIVSVAARGWPAGGEGTDQRTRRPRRGHP